MSTQFLTDERGQKVAVINLVADYEHLMEDVADLASVAERRDDERISLPSTILLPPSFRGHPSEGHILQKDTSFRGTGS